ncbi:MAG: flavodoxin family protein [Oscillospiraceae bacterium]|nr:flavodoxin family protein [Oscillospiraceae bacterium]
MAKKIIILNGSPRPNGNTAALTAQFRKGAEEAGNTVTEFQLAKMNIRGCLGCWQGGKDPAHPCVQRDDMERIYPVYREADIVVLASPLYYWFISGHLKNAFDRLFAIAECDLRTGVRVVLLRGGAGAGIPVVQILGGIGLRREDLLRIPAGERGDPLRHAAGGAGGGKNQHQNGAVCLGRRPVPGRALRRRRAGSGAAPLRFRFDRGAPPGRWLPRGSRRLSCIL